MTVTINGTTGIAGTNGSAGTPAVQGEDTNTGIFFPAADTVAVATAGAERLRVDSSGFVGIGTTSPASLFDIRGSSNGQNVLQLSNSAGTSDGGAENQIRVTCNGNTNWGNLDVQAYTTIFTTNGTERARIDSSGNLLVNTTGLDTANGTGVTLQKYANGSYITIAHTTSAGTGEGFMGFYRSSTQIGSITQSGTTGVAYNTTSDYRLKENVQPMQDALAKIAQLNPVTYTWKADGSAGQGFIAHELQAVVPDCVTGEKDAVDAEGNPQYQGVDTSFLVATLVKAIQELTARVAELEAK